MNATEILSQEHRVIERVLDALQTAATTLDNGGDVSPQFFVEASDFIHGFADGCHHQKEEGVLFKMMAANRMPTQDGPIGAMLHDHEMGRQYTRAMREAALQWQAGDIASKEQVIENALGYVALLRQHIHKEDNILFPLADRVIPVSEHSKVMAGFERVEHEETGQGIHEKYLALAESLVLQTALPR